MASSVFVGQVSPTGSLDLRSLTITALDPLISLSLIGDSGNAATIEIHNAFSVGEDIYTHSATAFRGPALNMYRSRGTQASPTTVSAGDALGYWNFGAYDTSAYAASFILTCLATETWTTGAHGTTMQIKNCLSGATSPSAAITINGDQANNVGIRLTSATAAVHLPAGAAAATRAPLKFTSGTNLTTAEAGAMEYNGTNLFFTRTGTTREGVLTQSAVTTEALVSDTSVTVNIGGTTYKLLARA